MKQNQLRIHRDVISKHNLSFYPFKSLKESSFSAKTKTFLLYKIIQALRVVEKTKGMLDRLFRRQNEELKNVEKNVIHSVSRREVFYFLCMYLRQFVILARITLNKGEKKTAIISSRLSVLILECLVCYYCNWTSLVNWKLLKALKDLRKTTITHHYYAIKYHSDSCIFCPSVKSATYNMI
jgi:thioredoxin-related protein